MRFSNSTPFGNDRVSDILFPGVSDHVEEELVPVLFGVTAVAVPYIAGAAIVAFAPNPYWKAIGVSMLVPSPTDVAVFYVGYKVGEKFQDEISLFDKRRYI